MKYILGELVVIAGAKGKAQSPVKLEECSHLEWSGVKLFRVEKFVAPKWVHLDTKEVFTIQY